MQKGIFVSKKGFSPPQVSEKESLIGAAIDVTGQGAAPLEPVEGTRSGNRCGHDPANPRTYTRDSDHKKTFDALQIASENAQRYAFSPEGVLDLIDFSRESDRQVRSERREAVSLVLGVLINHADMARLRVVRYLNGTSWRDMKITEIAKVANITVKRCERALKDLKRAGYLTLEKRFTFKKGAIRALVSIKRLNAVLFHHLGVGWGKLNQCIQWAKKRLERRQKQHSKAEAKLAYLAKQHNQNKQPTNKPQAPKTTGLAKLVQNLLPAQQQLHNQTQQQQALAQQRNQWFLKKMHLLQAEPDLDDAAILARLGAPPA